MKIALAQLNFTVGHLKQNGEKILQAVEAAKKKGAEIVLFSEMALLGYPPEDLLTLPSFIDAVEKELEDLIPKLQGVVALIGTVRKNPKGGEKGLFNSCAISDNGQLIGFYDKILLPTYDVFDEKRYFDSGSACTPWLLRGKKVAITICEDIWQHAGAVGYASYSQDPIEEYKKEQIDLCLNLSSSPYYYGRTQTRYYVGKKAAQSLKAPFLLCNQVGGNDSLIFDGYSFYLGKDGSLLSHAKGFQEDLLFIDTEKKAPALELESDEGGDLYAALVLGLRDYFQKSGFEKGLLGLSGGIDSAVVACLAHEALPSLEVYGLPSRFTSKESVEDATQLAMRLGIELRHLSIEKPFESFLEVLLPHFEGKEKDVTEENLQARIRGTLLMALSNKRGGLVLSTGNKSEIGLGYATLYGDMCGALGVLEDVTKAQVYQLAHWINRKKEIIPQRILEKEPTAELRANQKDSDSLPPYPVVDAVLKEYVEEHLAPELIAKKHSLPLSLVKELVRKIHLNEYKRRQAPPALRVTKKAFIAGRRFPIVQRWNVAQTDE